MVYVEIAAKLRFGLLFFVVLVTSDLLYGDASSLHIYLERGREREKERF